MNSGQGVSVLSSLFVCWSVQLVQLKIITSISKVIFSLYLVKCMKYVLIIYKKFNMGETSIQEDKHLGSKKKGPHGLGDPEDTFLRKVETEVLIPKIVRERSRKEKCIEEVAAFSKCGKENGLSIVFKCRKETELLQNCLVKWWNNADFQEECKKQYLHERSEFRRTGLGKNQHTGH